jgi:hypothetical protein
VPCGAGWWPAVRGRGGLEGCGWQVVVCVVVVVLLAVVSRVWCGLYGDGRGHPDLFEGGGVLRAVREEDLILSPRERCACE